MRPLRVSVTRSLSAPSAVNAYTRVSRRRTRRPAASRTAVAPQTFGTRVSRSSTRIAGGRDPADARARVVVAEDPAEVAALAQRVAVGAVLRHPDAVAEAAAVDHVVRARGGGGDERGEQGEQRRRRGGACGSQLRRAGERCGRGVMNASAVGSPASGPHRGDPAPGLDRGARRAEQRAELARARVEVGDDHRHAPQRGRVALDLDDLEDQRPEVDEGLPDRRLGRHAHAAQLEPGRRERGERARQVVRERDDVVDAPSRRWGARRGRRARPSRGARARARRAARPRGPRRASSSCAAPGAIRTSPTGLAGREAEPRPRGRLPGQGDLRGRRARR